MFVIKKVFVIKTVKDTVPGTKLVNLTEKKLLKRFTKKKKCKKQIKKSLEFKR